MNNETASADSIRSVVKDFILAQFLPGVEARELTNDTSLISGGILDSLATVRLVAFLEEHYGIEVAPHEASVDYLDTIDAIAGLVQTKLDCA